MWILFLALPASLTALLLLARAWYGLRVDRARCRVRHRDGRRVPGAAPRFLFGNLEEVYRAPNRLSAYQRFHERFGEIVQIFWMWRQQISLSDYRMARHVLSANHANYRKYPPNPVIRRLYGASVLTAEGGDWRRHRQLLNALLSRGRMARFHSLFVDGAERLAARWARLAGSGAAALDVYPDLLALSLDIAGRAATGEDFGALEGRSHPFLRDLECVFEQSMRPAHAFVRGWRHVPCSSNRRLAEALHRIDRFLAALIAARRRSLERSPAEAETLLDGLIQAASRQGAPPSADAEIRDDLVAILVNGHETVATGLAISLYLLALHPEQLARARAEADRAFLGEGGGAGRSPSEDLRDLRYLDCVVTESLRLHPPMAGLQRVSVEEDVLEGWSIPSGQVIGIALGPLHSNPLHFGAQPEEFRPERYLAEGACQPLSFGDGPRRCVGELFARDEMKVVLAILLRRFEFQVAPEFRAEPELKKFGLFISMFPRGGIRLCVRRASPGSREAR